MDQVDIWDKKWAKVKVCLPQTSFAIKTFNFIKNNNYSTLLDLGCGEGKDSIYFAKKEFNVTGIDFSKEAINKLNIFSKKENLKINGLVKDIKKINFSNEFDVVYANLSLHYFVNKDTQKIFDLIYNSLKVNGVFCFKCKSINDFEYGEGTEIEKDVFVSDNKQRHFFSKKYVGELLKKFNIININYCKEKHLQFDKGLVNSEFIEVIAKKSKE